jgi:Fe-Mn family superoxide dismutase
MITTHTKLRNDPAYHAAVKELLEISNSIIKDEMIITKHLQANAQLEELTDKLHNAFKAVGFDLTKSLIRTSILAIDKNDNSNRQLQNIDEKTMNIHYNKHYKGYVDKLNKALSKKDFGDLDLEEVIRSIGRFPKDIRNNAGGAFNHAMFWKMLSPTKQECKGELLKQIKKDFGSYIDFKNKFEMMAKKRFGSGWVWLVMTKRGVLKVMSTPNQDNPLMNVINRGGYPILGLDLWEHAYYLKYQNKRDEYIKNFWDVVNWEFVDKLYQMKKKTKLNESLVLGMIMTTL